MLVDTVVPVTASLDSGDDRDDAVQPGSADAAAPAKRAPAKRATSSGTSASQAGASKAATSKTAAAKRAATSAAAEKTAAAERAAATTAAKTAAVKKATAAAASARATTKATEAKTVSAKTAAAKKSTTARTTPAKKAAPAAKAKAAPAAKAAPVEQAAPVKKAAPAKKVTAAKTPTKKTPAAKPPRSTAKAAGATAASTQRAEQTDAAAMAPIDYIPALPSGAADSADAGASARRQMAASNSGAAATEARPPRGVKADATAGVAEPTAEANSTPPAAPVEPALESEPDTAVESDTALEQAPTVTADDVTSDDVTDAVGELEEASPTAGTEAIRIRGLVKRFGDSNAVDGIDLTVPAGSFYGLVGPNGAGKTTTLSIIAGLLRPDAGTVHISGIDQKANPLGAKRMMGVLPDRLRTFDRLTGRQLLHYYGQLRGLDRAVIEKRVADLARAFDLAEALGRVVSDYSAGMTKKLMLAGALIHSPRVLVLDEPFEAVDPVSSNVILDILRAYVAHGGTVILSSHGMDLVEQVCSRVAVIVGGEVLAEGTVDEVRAGQTLTERFVELSGTGGEVEGLEWLHTFSD